MIRQFDVYQNPSEGGRGTTPYLLVLQSHHLAALTTVVAAPLILPSLVEPDSLVLLPIEVEGIPFTLNLAVLGGIPAARLKSFVANLLEYEDAIRRGLDRLFTGF